jgi:2-oxo-4-hydroxy-4-carboxy-5-ureidoimidazoline decarboxylase
MTAPISLGALNAMDREAFVAVLGWIFEHSPWVAERAWELRPFSSFERLHRAMTQIVAASSAADQLALIRAHPDLGARARMSAASEGEQAGAGLDRLTAAEFRRLQQWNAAYREKFGFPFIYAVKGSGKQEILTALERRLDESPEAERATALEQIYRIAQFRLESTFACTTL